MDVRTALKGQYKAGLAMLRDCIAKCPDDIWAAGMPLITPDPGGRTNEEREARTFWRVAYHALFYTHLYAMPREEDFVAWERHDDLASNIWIGPDEPIPPKETTYSQADLLGYLDWMVTQVDAWVDAVDLDSQESGFHWYKDFPKLDHHAAVYEALSSDPRLDVPWAPDLSVVVFRLRGGDDAAQLRLLERINATQRILLSSTRIGGEVWLRVAVLSFRTHADRIEEAIRIISDSAAERQ